MFTRPGWVIVGLFAGAIATWVWWGTVGVGWMAKYWGGTANLSNLGQTGDLFGGINALFAAFAFAGVAIAAFYQYQTFQLLEHQHRLEERQRLQQSFEPLFFRLLELNQQRQLTRLRNRNDDPNGLSDAVEDLAAQFDQTEQRAWLGSNNDAVELKRYIDGIYRPFYERNEQALGPYFRSLYHLFKRIDQSALPEEQLIEYANIARATLGLNELFLLMINCATERGLEFKVLVQRYGILKHLPLKRGRTHLERAAALITPKVYSQLASLGAADRASLTAVHVRVSLRNGGHHD